MKLLFSEAESDYGRYLYPYVVWAVPEPGETPGDLLGQGWLPASPQLDCFYLCRNLRVRLNRFRLSSENRRILRKGDGIELELVPRAAFSYTEERRLAWKAYADRRFGDEVMSLERLDALMGAPVISHLLRFTDGAANREVGVALLYLEPPRLAYYYYAFYDLTYLPRNLGMHMMTRAVAWLAEQGFGDVHLGTCYSRRALYKTQFNGVEFFNGFRWSDDLAELKFLMARDERKLGRHALELAEYRETFYGGHLAEMARLSTFRVG